jgi:hypothetical protein
VLGIKAVPKLAETDIGLRPNPIEHAMPDAKRLPIRRASTRPGGPVTLAYCWSHLRRRFYEVYVGGNAPIATETLARIKLLYDR